jgi:hypothetical protein
MVVVYVAPYDMNVPVIQRRPVIVTVTTVKKLQAAPIPLAFSYKRLSYVLSLVE